MPSLRSDFLTTAESAPLLAAMHKESFSSAWSEEEFSALLKGPGTLIQILSLEEEPVGFCVYRIVENEAEILTLAILPAFRVRSYGENMLSDGCQALKDRHIQSLFLEVSVSNRAAIRLYEKAGFQQAGKRPNYYREDGKKVDALILKKSL